MTDSLEQTLTDLANAVRGDAAVRATVSLDKLADDLRAIGASEPNIDSVVTLNRFAVAIHRLQKRTAEMRNAHLCAVRQTVSLGDLARATGIERSNVTKITTRRRRVNGEPGRSRPSAS